jgi:hypothetical protein
VVGWGREADGVRSDGQPVHAFVITGTAGAGMVDRTFLFADCFSVAGDVLEGVAP